ncbi:MAG: hypothetical protein J0H62_05460, partial [Rhizobiales bacterium]|nr:hypothetical protein [Hyphomicrobiales bacterium]
FRGISQSDRGPSVGAYFEPRFKLSPMFELYAGIGGLSVKLPTAPTAEIDLYGGVRGTVGGLTLDVGYFYYYYPRETQLFFGDAFGTFVTPANLGFGAFTLRDTDFGEVYGKASYTFNDLFSIGANVYYTNNWLNSGFSGTYVSGTAKLTAPGGMLPSDIGAYLSGELGGYFFSGPLIDYTYWNVGVGLTYKMLTLDFRYHDTDLNRAQCAFMTGDLASLPSGGSPGQSRWCSSAFIVKLSADTTLSAFK